MSPSIRTMGFFMSEINFCNTKEQLNHLGEVVTGKVDGSPSGADIDTSTLPYTGQVRKTLPALESEYETSIANKESEADAAIDEYRLLNKGPYASGITLESKFEYVTYSGESYFATNPPYTTTATTPDADGNLFIGGYINESQAEFIAENAIISSTDLVYKAAGSSSPLDEMLVDFNLDPLAKAIGTIVKTGATTWEYTNSTGTISESNFRVFNAVAVVDFGADRFANNDSSDAIIRAINYAQSIGSNYGYGVLESSPPNTQTGQYPDIYLSPGHYIVTKELPYNKYHNFFGYGAIVQQTTPTSDIFTTETCYLNSFHGIKFVGGACSIQVKNTDDIGLEGCRIRIVDCDFTSSSDAQIKLLAGPTAGGEQAIIEACKFSQFKQAVISTFDIFHLKGCWLSTRASYQDNDTAWVEAGRVNVSDNMFVPIDGYNVSGNTNRYFDISLSATIEKNRFGAEGPSGLPIVYCFNDPRNTNTYPYQGGSCIIRDNHILYSGGPNRGDYGVIVLKSGIFKNIVIEGNGAGADGPYIRTDQMSVSFADYMDSLAQDANINRLSISIKSNQKWAGSICETQGSIDKLLPFMTYEIPLNGETIRHIGRLSASFKASQGNNTSPISNTLDEYEYGNFDLTFISSVGFTGAAGFSNQECKYVKIGKNVNISGGIRVNASGGTLSNGDYILVSGMPFVPENLENGNQQHVGQVIFYESIGSVNMGTGICLYNVGNDQTYIYVTNVLGVVDSDCNISFTVSYVED